MCIRDRAWSTVLVNPLTFQYCRWLTVADLQFPLGLVDDARISYETTSGKMARKNCSVVFNLRD